MCVYVSTCVVGEVVGFGGESGSVYWCTYMRVYVSTCAHCRILLQQAFVFVHRKWRSFSSWNGEALMEEVTSAMNGT